jgi:hypothetical protein
MRRPNTTTVVDASQSVNLTKDADVRGIRTVPQEMSREHSELCPVDSRRWLSPHESWPNEGNVPR